MQHALSCCFALALVSGSVAQTAEAAPAKPTLEAEVSRGILSLAPKTRVYRLLFFENQTELGSGQEAALRAIVERMETFEGQILIEAFDETGLGDATGERLSMERAKAVDRFLRRYTSRSNATLSILIHSNHKSSGMTPLNKKREGDVTVALLEPDVALEVAKEICKAKEVLGDQCPMDSHGWYVVPKLAVTPPEPSPMPTTTSKTEHEVATAPVKVKGQTVDRNDVRFLYIYAPTQPAAYHKLVYEGPESAESTHVAAGRAKPSAVGAIGLEFQGSLSPQLSFAAGIRYRRYPDFLGRSTFEPGTAKQDVLCRTTAVAYGSWFDVYPLQKILAQRLSARAGLGLDIDYSTVKVDEVYRDERVEGATTRSDDKVSSRLGVASLRIASGIAYGTRAIAVALNANFQLPLWSSGAKVQADDDADGWKRDLAHRPALGSELALGVVYRY